MARSRAEREGTPPPPEPARSERFKPLEDEAELGRQLTALIRLHPELREFTRSILDNAVAQACAARAEHLRRCALAKAAGTKQPVLHYRRAVDGWSVTTDDVPDPATGRRTGAAPRQDALHRDVRGAQPPPPREPRDLPRGRLGGGEAPLRLVGGQGGLPPGAPGGAAGARPRPTGRAAGDARRGGQGGPRRTDRGASGGEGGGGGRGQGGPSPAARQGAAGLAGRHGGPPAHEGRRARPRAPPRRPRLRDPRGGRRRPGDLPQAGLAGRQGRGAARHDGAARRAEARRDGGAPAPARLRAGDARERHAAAGRPRRQGGGDRLRGDRLRLGAPALRRPRARRPARCASPGRTGGA